MLVHYGTPLWYVESGVYHTNTRSFFSIVEKDFNIVNEKEKSFFLNSFVLLRSVLLVLIISLVW